MIDPLEHVRELATRARQEEAPRGHVSQKVILRLRRQPFALARPLTVFATLTGLLAATALLLTVYSMNSPAADALGAFFQVASLSNF